MPEALRFVCEKSNRSATDNGTYVEAVMNACRDYSAFENFKRHPHYQQVLEHVNEAYGQKYLDIIAKQTPHFLNLIENFRKNDLIGNPFTFNYKEVGQISPTTLRYMKVASDLQLYFGSNIGPKIAEIGVGYGGQLFVIDQVFPYKSCDLYDLPPVLELVSRYLESHIMNGSYRTTTLNQCSGDQAYDLVISNYAFSELPAHLQVAYIKKVISKSSRGYMTMNSGMENSACTENRLTVDQLRKLLPPFEIVEENPLTFVGNYIIVWGR